MTAQKWPTTALQKDQISLLPGFSVLQSNYQRKFLLALIAQPTEDGGETRVTFYNLTAKPFYHCGSTGKFRKTLLMGQTSHKISPTVGKGSKLQSLIPLALVLGLGKTVGRASGDKSPGLEPGAALAPYTRPDSHISNDHADSSWAGQGFAPQEGLRVEGLLPEDIAQRGRDGEFHKRALPERRNLSFSTKEALFQRLQILLISASDYSQRKHSHFTVSESEKEWSRWVERVPGSQGPGLWNLASHQIACQLSVLESSYSTVWSAVPRPGGGLLPQCPPRSPPSLH
jgi:hypothetical protein